MLLDHEGIDELAGEQGARLRELRRLLIELRGVIEATTEGVSRRKETKVLTLSSLVVRLLDGGRLISCKSGKDRTGMAATLAAAAFCGEFGRDNEPAVLATANLLRAHGTRIRI